jgi:ParB/RepB/Spo0J family partition protein
MSTKQLPLYETLDNAPGRTVWRSSLKTLRSTYKIEFKRIHILPNWNIRKEFTGIEELAKDIQQNGLNEPLRGVMSQDGKKFFVVDGERRFRALQLLIKNGDVIDEVEIMPLPAKMNAQGMIAQMISSGVNKCLYNDIEIADGLKRLKHDFSMSNQDIADQIGKSRQYVDGMIRLAEQPEEIKKDVRDGKVKKTTIIAPQKDRGPKEVVEGMMASKPQPGLPASLKTDNEKAEKSNDNIAPLPQQSEPGKVTSGKDAPTAVSGKDALQGVNFDKEINEQEGQINVIWKEVNKVEGLGKGLNDQAQKDLDKYLFVIRDNLTKLKDHYSKVKNRKVL